MAVLVTIPPTVGRTTIVTVAELPEATLVRLHVTVPEAFAQPPWVEVYELVLKA